MVYYIKPILILLGKPPWHITWEEAFSGNQFLWKPHWRKRFVAGFYPDSSSLGGGGKIGRGTPWRARSASLYGESEGGALSVVQGQSPWARGQGRSPLKLMTFCEYEHQFCITS